MINIFQPAIGKEEIEILKKVFESNWIGKGNYVTEFEKSFAKHHNGDSAHFVSTTSCSEAILLAGGLFNFNSNDEIIAPSISFLAVGTSILSKNATMVLCDVDRRTLNARAEDIEGKITPRTKAVFLNHYGGFPCDMDPIMDLCGRHNIIVIEDSGSAIKCFYKGKACGTIGDMGMWSVGAMKTVCVGDGGMIYLRSDELVTVAKELLYHGLPVKQKSGTDSAASGNSKWWEIEINRFGKRAIMNNIAGALGVEQLKKLDTFLFRRKEIYERYARELSECEWLTLPPEIGNNIIPSYYFFWIQLGKRDELARFLFENGVYSTFRYWPLHRIKYFGQARVDLPNADYVSQHTLNIPLHQSLSDNDVSKVLDLIKEFGRRFL